MRIAYDVEVLRGPDEVEGGWENPEGMGFASAVAYVWEQDRYHFFMGEEGCNSLIALLRGNTAVSFNGIKFDSRVILGNARIANDDGVISLPHDFGAPFWKEYDILAEYIRARFGLQNVGMAELKLGDKAIHDGSFGLDGLAEGTLGLNKTGHGAKAPILYREEKYAELFSYNLQDVRLTRKLADFIQAYHYLVDRNGLKVRIE